MTLTKTELMAQSEDMLLPKKGTILLTLSKHAHKVTVLTLCMCLCVCS